MFVFPSPLHKQSKEPSKRRRNYILHKPRIKRSCRDSNMVARKFSVSHGDSSFDVDYDTDDGVEVFKFQLFSLTSIPPDELKIVGDDDDRRLVADDSDLVTVGDKLKLLSIEEEPVNDSREEDEEEVEKEELLKSDEEFARMLQAEEEALMLQRYSVVGDSDGGFENRLRPHISQVLMYEDPIRQEAARKTVPVEELEEKAFVSLAKEGNFNPSRTEQLRAFLLQLLFWFKQSFRWVDAPPCDGCGNETTILSIVNALPSEIQYRADRVELYRCQFCLRTTRFPRYNDPLKLVETRKGRCGEWANCFTLYCRAFGYDSRLVLDFTDHVWTECFVQSWRRWMHLDPCEGIYDKPLLYEKGWNKKLNYVIAVAKDGVYDVTKRYTRKWHEVLSRRNIALEQTVSSVLTKLTQECRRNLASDVLSALQDRDIFEREELERCIPSADDVRVSLPGRQSGDKGWRIARLEIGADDNSSLGLSSCPVRVCMDEHVTKIYNAFSPVLSQIVEYDISKSRAVEVLKILKGILVDLRKLHYKTRRVCLTSVSSDGQKILRQLLPSLCLLFDALSLKYELDADEKVDVDLAGDPVKTSLSLPVALDAFDDLIDDLNNCNNFGQDSLSLPLLKLNRIHSGSVLASGEEIPLGIATSAFDGTRLSKWEEPNGGKGCWITYKLRDNQMHELMAYELMSANDAPDRDPRDWVVEGSNDWGSTWHTLDEQTSQMFKNRFQRKTYKIKSTGFLSNVFRFRFLAVQNVNKTPRLQIGSIDMYASSS